MLTYVHMPHKELTCCSALCFIFHLVQSGAACGQTYSLPTWSAAESPLFHGVCKYLLGAIWVVDSNWTWTYDILCFCQCIFAEAFSCCLNSSLHPLSGGVPVVVMTSSGRGHRLHYCRRETQVSLWSLWQELPLAGRAHLVLSLDLTPSEKCKDTPFWEP